MAMRAACLRRIPLEPIILACALFFLTLLWVPLHVNVPISFDWHYYSATLWPFAPRALTGTLARLLQIPTDDFPLFIQLFRLMWLTGLCLQLYVGIPDHYKAMLLCVMFAFSSFGYVDNAVELVDCAANFWLLLAACMSLHETPRRRMLHAACIVAALCCAQLAHEKSLFPAAVIVLWNILRQRPFARAMGATYACAIALYLWLSWERATQGLSVHDYGAILTDDPLHFLAYQSFNLIGVFTSIGMLWGVYFWVGCRAVRHEKTRRERYRLAVFLIGGIALNMATLLIAYDTQRMISGLWVPLFMLLGDRTLPISQLLGPVHRYPLLLAAACALQLLIPPVFIYNQIGVPLNCYAKSAMEALAPRSLALIPRRDISGPLTCWPPSVLRK